MPAPVRPNTEAATAATKRRGDETAAARLRAAGWTVSPPEQAEADRRWSDAVDWLLNSSHTADPDIQGPFWAHVEGHITLAELRRFNIGDVEKRYAKLGIEE